MICGQNQNKGESSLSSFMFNMPSIYVEHSFIQKSGDNSLQQNYEWLANVSAGKGNMKEKIIGYYWIIELFDIIGKE